MHREEIVVIEKHMHQTLAGSHLGISRSGNSAVRPARKRSQALPVPQTRRLFREKLAARGEFVLGGRASQQSDERDL